MTDFKLIENVAVHVKMVNNDFVVIINVNVSASINIMK
jgi:hypothetical protein